MKYSQNQIDNALRWLHEVGYYSCPAEIQLILDWLDGRV